MPLVKCDYVTCKHNKKKWCIAPQIEYVSVNMLDEISCCEECEDQIGANGFDDLQTCKTYEYNENWIAEVREEHKK